MRKLKVLKKRVLITIDRAIHSGGVKRAKEIGCSFSRLAERLVENEIEYPRLKKINHKIHRGKK